MSRHASVPSVTIGTHRLWISLWTRLGQHEDNTQGPGGNQQAYGGENAALHTASRDGHCPRTGSVVTESRPDQRGNHLSPGSTAPTTTTNYFFTTTPHASRCVARTRPRNRLRGGTRSRLEVRVRSGPQACQTYAPEPHALTRPAQHRTGQAARQHLTGGSFR